MSSAEPIDEDIIMRAADDRIRKIRENNWDSAITSARINEVNETTDEILRALGITHHVNEAVRTRTSTTRSLLNMLDDDLLAAWVAWSKIKQTDPGGAKKADVVRGRIRGLAQAITTVRSPFSREDLGAKSTAWADAIKRTETESLAVAKRRGMLG